MAEIRNLTRNGETFYPLTCTDAVVDRDGNPLEIVNDIFDISEYNASGTPPTLATYSTLALALAAVPQSKQKGGMTIRYVQSSDNKYVQYRLMTSAWSTTVTNWQGVDEKPLLGSDNMVKSYGIAEPIQTLKSIFVRADNGFLQSKTVGDRSVANISINSFLVAGIVGLQSGSYLSVSGGDFTMDNLTALVLDTQSNTLSIMNLNGQYPLALASGNNKIVLAVNLSGVLYSPIASLDDLLKKEQNLLSDIYYDGFQVYDMKSRYIKISNHQFKAGDIFYVKVRSHASGVVNVGLLKNTEWTTQNIIASININNADFITGVLDEDSDLYLYIYENQVSYDGTEIEVSYGAGASCSYQNKLSNIRIAGAYANRIPLNINIIKNGNNVTLTCPSFLISGVDNNDKYASVPAITDVSIANTYCLAYNTKTATNSIKLMRNVNDTDILLFLNFHGVLYSPIASLNALLYQAQGLYLTAKIQYTDIVIEPDSTPNKIANAVRGITDNGVAKRYRIFVKNGVYDEIDIQTKDYVDIIGEDVNKTIIYTDGNAEYNSPANYKFAQYSNTKVADIPIEYKHTFWHVSSSTVSNCTIKATECKYPVHQDDTGYHKSPRLENVIIVDAGSVSVLGVGIHGGQHRTYKNCMFVVDLLKSTNLEYNYSFNIHNWNNQTEPTKIEFDECSFLNCKNLNIVELGSTQSDQVIFKDCYSDNNCAIVHTAITGYYRKDGVVVTDVQLIPYSIRISTAGNDIPLIKDISRRTYNLQDFGNNIYNCLTSETINIGDVVTKNGVNVSKALSGDVLTSALCDVSSNGEVIVSKSRRQYVKAVADTYTIGDTLAINDGKLQKSQTNAVAIVAIAATLSSDGLIFVDLI